MLQQNLAVAGVQSLIISSINTAVILIKLTSYLLSHENP